MYVFKVLQINFEQKMYFDVYYLFNEEKIIEHIFDDLFDLKGHLPNINKKCYNVRTGINCNYLVVSD